MSKHKHNKDNTNGKYYTELGYWIYWIEIVCAGDFDNEGFHLDCK